MQLSSIRSCSSCLMPECTAAAFMPRIRSCETWSFISATSGVMTMHSPSIAITGTWKHIDLPPPVGIRPKVSRPAMTLSMISRCMLRKLS